MTWRWVLAIVAAVAAMSVFYLAIYLAYRDQWAGSTPVDPDDARKDEIREKLAKGDVSDAEEIIANGDLLRIVVADEELFRKLISEYVAQGLHLEEGCGP